MGRHSGFGASVVSAVAILATAPPVSAQPPPGARLDALEQSGLQTMGGGQRLQPIEIHPDRSVTFRLRAPAAKSVEIAGHIIGPNAHWRSVHKSLPMTRDDQGVWSITLGPLAPEIYDYGFVVDGASIGDLTQKAYNLEIPTPTPAYYDAQPNVAHGEVRSVVFYSKSIGAMRYMRVYTPPGYDGGKTRFPVVYLLHGNACCEDMWVDAVRANTILDNLIAAHKAKPMIVVMPHGGRYGPSFGLTPIPAQMSDPPPQADLNAGPQSNYAPGNYFEHDLIEEIIPLIDHKYRTLADADHRAIAGLSQGGIQSVTIGLRHTEIFHWVVPMSAGAENQGDDQLVRVTQDIVSHPDPLKKNLKLLMFLVGDQDVLHEADKRLADALTGVGVKLTFKSVPGMHEFKVWRMGLRDVAPLLFTSSAKSKPQ